MGGMAFSENFGLVFYYRRGDSPFSLSRAESAKSKMHEAGKIPGHVLAKTKMFNVLVLLSCSNVLISETRTG